MSEQHENESFDQFAGVPGDESLSIGGYPFDPMQIRARDLRKMRKDMKAMPEDADEEDYMMEIMENLIVGTIQRDHPDADAEAIADAITLQHFDALDKAWEGNE